LIAQASHRRRSLSPQQYVDGILQGQRTVLAQAITMIESSRAADRELAERILEDCFPTAANPFASASLGSWRGQEQRNRSARHLPDS